MCIQIEVMFHDYKLIEAGKFYMIHFSSHSFKCVDKEICLKAYGFRT